jgi:lysozyme
VRMRVAVAGLSLSAAAFVGILTREGYTDHAIIPVKGDVPTVGFGTTQGVQMGDRTTPVRAVQRALADASEYERAVKRCVTAPLYPEEYDLWIDFVYNIGPTSFCASTAVRLLNQRQYTAACDQILRWKFVKGYDCSTPGNRVCHGLWKDRLRQHEECVKAASA